MTDGRRDAVRPLVLCAVVMELAYLSHYLARTGSDFSALTLLAYAVAGVAFVWLVWRVRAGGWDRPSRATWGVVIGAAVVFRLTLLSLGPSTGADAKRYLWEGIIQTHGFNPYISAPDAPELAPLADEYASLHQTIEHRHIPAIYPPFAQLLFRLNAVVFGGTMLGWQVILLLFDLLLAAAVVMALRHLNAPRIGIVLVLWCPLLLLETYVGAHLDVIGVSLLVLAIAAMQGGRWGTSAVVAALSINVKYLWPLIGMIVWLPHAPRRRGGAFVVLTATVAAACWLPYLSGIESAVATAGMFAGKWAFNDPAFELLRWLLGRGWEPMALVMVLLVGLGFLLVIRKPRTPWQDTWLLGGTALFLGPVAYPWYFVWIVPGLALRPSWWIAAWVASVPVLHWALWRYAATGQWDPMYWLWGVLAVVPAIGLTLAWCRRLGIVENTKPVERVVPVTLGEPG